MIDVKEKLLQRMQEQPSDHKDYVLHMFSFGEIERLQKETDAMTKEVEYSREKILRLQKEIRKLQRWRFP
jgi:peptidoglycan hydrolase CwlO-like protein